MDYEGSIAPGTKKQRAVKKMSWKKWAALLVIIAVLAAAGWFAYDYKQTKDENQKLSNPTEAAKEATSALVAEVGQLVELPTGETPTIATVSDITKLQGQAFFAKGANGDKVLIYTQAKRAILYRPSTKKVIEIAPVNLGNNSANSNSSNGTQ